MFTWPTENGQVLLIVGRPTIGQLVLVNCRCTTPTRVQGHQGHFSRYMLGPAHPRTPRDLEVLRHIVEQAEQERVINVAEEMVAAYGLWPVQTALLLMHPFFNQYLQVVWDSLHVFDGGVTNRLIVLFGNWYYRLHMDGQAALGLLNERLASMPRVDDFTHFDRPFLSLDTESNSSRPVKMSVNFRCEEYRQLVQQIM